MTWLKLVIHSLDPEFLFPELLDSSGSQVTLTQGAWRSLAGLARPEGRMCVLGAGVLAKWPPEVLVRSCASPKSHVFGWPCNSQRLSDINCLLPRKPGRWQAAKCAEWNTMQLGKAALLKLKSLQDVLLSKKNCRTVCKML